MSGYFNHSDLEKYLSEHSGSDNILPFVKRKDGYAQRIVLSGTHGTGKTTLFNFLQHELKKSIYYRHGLNYVFREEPIRLIQKYGFNINQKAGDDSQLAMAAFHMATLGYDCFVSDRCIVDLYVYARYLSEWHGGQSPVVSKHTVQFLERLVYQFVSQFKGIVFMFYADLDQAIPVDDVRDTDWKFRDGIQNMMLQVWNELGKTSHLSSIQVEYMPDHFADRVKLAMGYIKDSNFDFERE